MAVWGGGGVGWLSSEINEVYRDELLSRGIGGKDEETRVLK